MGNNFTTQFFLLFSTLFPLINWLEKWICNVWELVKSKVDKYISKKRLFYLKKESGKTDFCFCFTLFEKKTIEKYRFVSFFYCVWWFGKIIFICIIQFFLFSIVKQKSTVFNIFGRRIWKVEKMKNRVFSISSSSIWLN